jgi:hypothetical protein
MTDSHSCSRNRLKKVAQPLSTQNLSYMIFLAGNDAGNKTLKLPQLDIDRCGYNRAMITRGQLWDASIAVMGRVYGNGVEEQSRRMLR